MVAVEHMPLHWVIQDDLFHEEGQRELHDLLIRFDVPHTLVRMVPFTHELDPEPVVTGPVIVMGSVGLTRIAIERGWVPGAFYNDEFRFEAWIEYYGDELLNADAVVSRLDEVAFDAPELFIRPNEDLKKFNGRVFTREEFDAWRAGMRSSGTPLPGETMVVASGVKRIQRECRFFVVGGKVVTGSQYRVGRRVAYDSAIDGAMTCYAQRIVDIWSPAEAFCLDVAQTDEGYRVIEINCINSAGFYAANIPALYEALSMLR